MATCKAVQIGWESAASDRREIDSLAKSSCFKDQDGPSGKDVSDCSQRSIDSQNSGHETINFRPIDAHCAPWPVNMPRMPGTSLGFKRDRVPISLGVPASASSTALS